MESAPSPVPGRKFQIPPRVQYFLKFALAGALIWGLVHSDMLDPRLILNAMMKHPWFCLFGFLVYLGPVVFAGWLRWHVILRYAGIQVSAWRSFRLQMVGLFFNSMVPGGNGGDLVKGYYLFKDQKNGNPTLALTSIFMDRLVGTYGILCLGLIMAWLNYSLWKNSTLLQWNSLFYLVVFVVFTAILGFFLSPFSARFLSHKGWGRLPGGQFFISLGNSLLVYRHRPKGLWLALAVGVIVDTGLILFYFISAKTLDLEIPLLVQGFVVPTMTMINGLPISPSGVGVGEAAGELIYRNVGVLQGGSEILALVHICILGTSFLGAPFYFFFKSSRNLSKAPKTFP